MKLSPREVDKLVLHGAGVLAQKRLARGLRLNQPEAVALIATQKLMRPMFGMLGKACSAQSTAVVSKAALEAGVKASYGLEKRVEAVQNVRSIGKADMKLNDAMPVIEVDPESYHVTADKVPLVCEPAQTLPLTQNYLLF